MQASRDDPGSRPRHLRGGYALAIALAVCALLAGTKALSPTPAPAMTSEDMATICSSFVSELNRDPSVCIPNLFPRSAGSGETSSHATEPKPGVILIVDPKLWRCFGATYVPPGATCPGQRRNAGNLGFTGFGERAGPPTTTPAWERKNSREGSLKRCVWSHVTLKEAADALRDLKKLKDDRSAWGPDGNLADSRASRALGAKYDETQGWFAMGVREALAKRKEKLESVTDLSLLNLMRVGWEMTRDEINREWENTACFVVT